MVKISVIGTGHLGNIHTRLWKSNPNIELSGIYDIDEERTAKIAGEYGCKAFKTIEEALENSDGTTIAVPTSLHHEVGLKCIDKAVHCLIEKPVTSNSIEAYDLIKKAGEKGIIIQVGHVERFNPALASLKDFKLNPMFIEAHRLAQFKPRATDVSVILDLMIHDIDIMLWLVKSKVSKIDANGVAVLTETPDICNARITFENGAVANLTASRISANPMRKMRIFQQNAYISMDFGRQDVEIFRIMDDNEHAGIADIPATMLGTIEAGLKNKKIVYQKPVVPEFNAIAEEQKAFIKAIEDKSPVAVSAEEAAEALRIAELIAEQL
ncbi:Gfo/Idh/MocA family protein [Bacteroidota bacterium]